MKAWWKWWNSVSW